MAPKRKSMAEGATTVAAGGEGEAGSAKMLDEEGNIAGESMATTTTTSMPSKPINFMTKQQKDAAGGADGIDQYELAKTQVTKVAKSAVPDNMQLRKEVILGLIKSSTVFISYLASAALDKTHEAGNKTLSATHVINAFKEMGFPEEYATRLRREYNEKVKLEADRTKANKAAKADAAKAEEQSMDVDADDVVEEGEGISVAEGIGMLPDESIAVDLSKEGAEEEMEEEADEGDDGAGEEDDDDDDDDNDDDDDDDGDKEDEEDEEGVEGDLGIDDREHEAMGEPSSTE